MPYVMPRASGLALLLASLVGSPARADEPFTPCGSASQMLALAASEMSEFDAASAEASLAQALQRWGCGERATPQQITEYFLLQVAVALLGQQTDRVDELYLAAKGAARSGDVDLKTAIGPVVQLDPMAGAAYAGAASPGTTELEIIGAPPSWTASVSGSPYRAGAYPQGRYLIQLLDDQGRSRWAEEIVLEAEEQAVVIPTNRVPPRLRVARRAATSDGHTRDATDARPGTASHEAGPRQPEHTTDPAPSDEWIVCRTLSSRSQWSNSEVPSSKSTWTWDGRVATASNTSGGTRSTTTHTFNAYGYPVESVMQVTAPAAARQTYTTANTWECAETSGQHAPCRLLGTKHTGAATIIRQFRWDGPIGVGLTATESGNQGSGEQSANAYGFPTEITQIPRDVRMPSTYTQNTYTCDAEAPKYHQLRCRLQTSSLASSSPSSPPRKLANTSYTWEGTHTSTARHEQTGGSGYTARTTYNAYGYPTRIDQRLDSGESVTMTWQYDCGPW